MQILLIYSSDSYLPLFLDVLLLCPWMRLKLFQKHHCLTRLQLVPPDLQGAMRHLVMHMNCSTVRRCLRVWLLRSEGSSVSPIRYNLSLLALLIYVRLLKPCSLSSVCLMRYSFYGCDYLGCFAVLANLSFLMFNCFGICFFFLS